jgi:hypothetical protein
LPDSANVFNDVIRRSEVTMAIETAPPEGDMPEPRRRRRNRSTLWRLCAWGGSATIALVAVALTTQTESGYERLQLALAQKDPSARAVRTAVVTPRVAENDAETQRLQAQIRTLAADRDRLTARIASLEHSLDDITGSIKRQAELAAAPPAPSTPLPTPQAAAQPPAPAIAPVALAPPVIAPLATPPSADAVAPWPQASSPQAATPAPDPVPLPPVRMAATAASEPAGEPPRKPEIGIDLGGAPNLAVLTARWAAVKANFGPLLTGLHPLAAHAQRPGATDYRLVVGPLPNAAAAAHLCARFAAARVTCRPAKFDGQRIAQQ